MPLSMVSSGKKVKLRAIHAGRGLQRRLAEMGLIPGVELEVISNGHHGPFIIAVKNTRLMLGRGMAHHIEVE